MHKHLRLTCYALLCLLMPIGVMAQTEHTYLDRALPGSWYPEPGESGEREFRRLERGIQRRHGLPLRSSSLLIHPYEGTATRGKGGATELPLPTDGRTDHPETV